MRNRDRFTLGFLFLIAIAVTSNALACSTDGWDLAWYGDDAPESLPNNMAVGSPLPAGPGAQARFEEFCSLTVFADSTATGDGFVQDNNVSHDRLRARFYFSSELTGAGDVEIFQVFDYEPGLPAPRGPGGAKVFSISYDGTNLTFDTTHGGGGATAVVAAAAGDDWNIIEFDLNTTADTLDYWVNVDAADEAATGQIDGGAGTVTMESVRLGLPDGIDTFGGRALFDSYESHATTVIGANKPGDANGDGNCNALDTLTVQLEILQISLAGGTPDCNYSGGTINAADTLCGQLVILAGGCP